MSRIITESDIITEITHKKIDSCKDCIHNYTKETDYYCNRTQKKIQDISRIAEYCPLPTNDEV